MYRCNLISRNSRCPLDSRQFTSRKSRMERLRKRRGAITEEGNGGGGGGGGGYEKLRELRIKENRERMQKLGLFELSLKLKPPPPPAPKTRRNLSSDDEKIQTNLPPRRSSRLKALSPVNYADPPIKRSLLKNFEEKPKNKLRKTKFSSQNKSSDSDDDEIEVDINLKEGSKPEIYTEAEEKLLGDSKMKWTLLLDGFDENGLRIYDPFNGETCHQCSKCKMVQGQLCGDCLYTRYGENVIEVNQNPDCIFPVCRGICNCSRCRLSRGWRPTGDIYRKVKKLGFKSVAHYLIRTHRDRVNTESSVSEEPCLHSLPNETMDIDDDEDSSGCTRTLGETCEDGKQEEEEKEVNCLGSNYDANGVDIDCKLDLIGKHA